MHANRAQVVSLCARLARQPGVIAAEASRRVQGYASSPELQARAVHAAKNQTLRQFYCSAPEVGVL